MAKIKVVCIFILFITIELFSLGTVHVEASEIKPYTFALPLSLQEIGEETFSGTAVVTVVFPDGFLRVGEKAFDKAWHLTDIYIPETTEYIADSAFPIIPNLTIHGIDGSYAEDWAYSHEIPFVVDNVWNIIVQNGRTHSTRTDPIRRYIATLVLIILFTFFRLSYYEVRSRRPQDRPELNPIDYCFP